MNYPEHDKLQLVKDRSQACGEFMDWLLNEKKIELAEWGVDQDEAADHPEAETPFLWPISRPWTSLLAEFFGIDEKKLEAETVAMLEEMRKGNSK